MAGEIVRYGGGELVTRRQQRDLQDHRLRLQKEREAALQATELAYAQEIERGRIAQFRVEGGQHLTKRLLELAGDTFDLVEKVSERSPFLARISHEVFETTVIASAADIARFARGGSF